MMMYADIPAALDERDARSLNIGSKESTPNGEEEESSSSGATEIMSEYEREKQRNLHRNAELLRKFDEEYAQKHGGTPPPIPSTSTKKPRKKKEKKKSSANIERRTSPRW